jgi:hypothetical protein
LDVPIRADRPPASTTPAHLGVMSTEPGMRSC